VLPTLLSAQKPRAFAREKQNPETATSSVKIARPTGPERGGCKKEGKRDSQVSWALIGGRGGEGADYVCRLRPATDEPGRTGKAAERRVGA
jgi:hypothetical protein